MRRFVSFVVGTYLASVGASTAYPIDCAILLCLAGGFPPSAECAAAKAEVIRRITPVPVEPPLQLWNCPMSVPPELATQIGLSLSASFGLTPEVRKYRDGIEIYNIESFFHRENRNGDDVLNDRTFRGLYSQESGEFSWVEASYSRGPSWLSNAVGGSSLPIRQCVKSNRHGDCTGWKTVGSTNDYNGHLRAVVMRFKDFDGTFHVEVVHY